jgi:putative endonuclease
MSDQKRLGDWGESLTATYLEGQGYAILARNWHCRFGELDVVATKDGILAVVEVKTRKSDRFMTAREAVDHRKRQCLWRSAEQWLCAHPEEEWVVRFDVAEVYLPQAGAAPQFHYLEDAFQEA